MISKKYLFPMALATAAGAPYVALDDDLAKAAKSAVEQVWPSTGSEAGAVGAATGSSGSTELTWPPLASEVPTTAAALPLDSHLGELIAGPPTSQLGEVIRFDVPPNWVTSRWPRVTSTLSELGLEGLRVPVVTGTQVHDIAGSLTYYFDRQHQMQRVTLEGFTGDPSQLVALVTQHYGLQPEPTFDAALYVARWNGKPTSILRITRSPVMSAGSPHSQLQVQLELNRPSVTFSLSPQFQQQLDLDRQSQRW